MKYIPFGVLVVASTLIVGLPACQNATAQQTPKPPSVPGGPATSSEPGDDGCPSVTGGDPIPHCKPLRRTPTPQPLR